MNVLITGANRGLGVQLAQLALERGHHVYAGVREPERADKLAALQNAHPGKLHVLALDVTDEDAVRAAAAQLQASGVQLDVLVNNAAIVLGRKDKIESVQLNEAAETFDVNVFGPMRVVKHLLALVPRDAASLILNISSISGSTSRAYGGDYPYAMSKTALNMFSLQLRRELEPAGIRVYAVHPGWIKTDMGGPEAPGEPAESAAGLMDLIERKTVPAEGVVFMDYRGEAMQL